ncbi:MAG: nucleotidyltransferase domain-containing protein [Dysgonamonadaceae bacterium]|jgi:predicted nucleotidyltransferase|nr:nucleotidyltransferase domain-containing protein [Dysgonamonadaceae bacterium]
MKTLNKYGLSERDSRVIYGIFNKYSEVRDVILFGSRAKGNFHSGSDIDFAVRGKVPAKIMRRIKSDFEESSLPYNVDIVYMELLKNSALKEHIDRVGEII